MNKSKYLELYEIGANWESGLAELEDKYAGPDCWAIVDGYLDARDGNTDNLDSADNFLDTLD